MIATWFACQCLRSSQDQTAVALANVSILRDPNADDELVLIALTQIQHMDPWLQGLLFPEVCLRARLKPLSREARLAGAALLDGLLDRLPDEARASLGRLTQLAFDPGRAVEFAPVLREKAAALVDGGHVHPEPPVAGAYHDLMEHLAAVLLLSCAVALRGLPDGTALDRVDETEPFERLLDDASAHRLGRLAFLLALDLRRLRGDLDGPRDAAHACAVVPVKVCQMSPDVLSVAARIAHGRSSAEGIFQDSMTAHNLRLVLEPRPERRRWMRLSAEVLGFGGQPSTREATPLILWAACCWEVLAERDPDEVARVLAPLFGPPTRSPTSLRIDGADDIWREGLDHLQTVRNATLTNPRRFDIQGPPESLRRAMRIFHGPWLDLNGSWKASSRPSKERRYPQSITPLLMLRLGAAALVATRVLARAPTSGREPLCALLAHTADVLQMHRSWLPHRLDAPADERLPSLPGPLRGWIAHVKRQVDRAGRGELACPTPEDFTRLLELPEEPFRSRALPLALVKWSADALTNALPNTPAARWRDHLGTVLDAVDAMEDAHVTSTDQTRAALLELFHGEYEPTGDRINALVEDLTRSVATGVISPKCHPADLLLLTKVPAATWMALSLPATESLPSDAQSQLPLAVTLQHIDADIDDSSADIWLDRLENIGDTRTIDRYLRAKMVDVLSSPALKHDVDVREVLVQLLLECAGPFDLWRVLGVLFPNDPAAWQEETDVAFDDLRERSVRAVWRALHTPDPPDRNAEDPYLIRQKRQRREILAQTIERIAWFCTHLRAETDRLTVLREALRDQINARWDWRARRRTDSMPIAIDVPGLRHIIATLDRRDKQQVAVVPAGTPTADALVHHIVVNRARGMCTATLDDVESVVDLAAWPDRIVQTWLEAKRGSVVEVLGRVHRYASRCLTIDIGLQDPVEARNVPELPVGEPLVVEVEIGPSPRLVGQRLVRWCRRAGDIRSARVRAQGGRIEVQVDGELTSEFDDAAWLPDIVPWTRWRGHAEEWSLDVERGADGRWWPRAMELVELMLHLPGRQRWVCTGRMPKDLTAPMRFAVRRDLHVLVPRSAWDEDALDQLMEADLGLAVHADLVWEGERVRIRLVEDSPFDDANLRWQALFRDQARDASRDARGRWTTPVPPELVDAGFPAVIDVTFERPQRNGPPRYPIVVERWGRREQRCAEVIADTPDVLVAHVPDKEFVQTWLNAPSELEHRFMRARAMGDDWLVTTKQNLSMLVDTEDLSLATADLGQRQVLDALADRPITLQVIRKDSHRIQFDFRPTDDGNAPETTCRGMVSQVMFDDRRTTAVGVTWEDGSTSQIRLPAPGDVRLGSWVQITVDDTTRFVTIETPILKVIPLWTIVALTPDQSVTVIGRRAGDSRWLAEVRPGELCFLPDGQSRWPLFETGTLMDLEARSTESADGWKDVQTGNRRWFDQRTQVWVRRSLWRLGESVVRGLCPVDAPHDKAILTDAEIDLHPHHAEWRTARRRLHVRQGAMPPEKRARSDRSRDLSSDRLAKWKAWQEQKSEKADWEPLHATRIGNQVRLDLWVPTIPDNGWTREVPISPEGWPWFHTSDEWHVDLVKADQGWLATCRTTPPWSVRKFWSMAGAQSNTEVILQRPLVYIGPAKNPENRKVFRFEWEPGRILEVDDEHVRFDQGAKPLELSLFYGDRIQRVRFIEQANEDLILDVVEASIDLAEATQLYDQATKLGLVHVLVLGRRDATLRVQAVIGFSREAERSEREFTRSEATITSTDQSRLLDRLDADDPEAKILVLGKLDVERFRESSGREVVYRHVRLSMTAADGVPGLRDNDLIFFRAHSIKDMQNDTSLELRPLPIYERDIGPEFMFSRLLRRDVSARPDTLRRLQARSDARLEGAWVFARVRREGDAVRAGLLSTERGLRGVPARRLRVLLALLASRHQVYASVVGQDDRGVLFELRAFVFVFVRREVMNAEPRLTPGELVRLRAGPQGTVEVACAAFSDLRYVDAEQPRPVVILPKNPLRKLAPLTVPQAPQEETWREAARLAHGSPFTIGDLPTIEAGVGAPGTEARFLRRDLLHWLATPHPRIGGLLRDKIKDSCWLVPFQGHLAAHLSVDQGELIVHPWAGAPPTRLPWCQASYADESISDLETRLTGARWRWHDDFALDVIDGKARFTRMPDVTAEMGPVFFGRHPSGEPTLRPAVATMHRTGVSSDALFHVLRTEREATLVVAGPSDSDALWIEVGPGRFSEIRREILIFRLAEYEYALDGLDMNLFAPGDRVLVALHSGDDAMEPDRVQLRSWSPGPRGAFGRCSILPVRPETAGSRLGAGGWQMTIPAICDASVVALDGENHVHERVRPQVQDVALLVIDQDRTPRLAGFPRVTVGFGREPGGEDPVGVVLARARSEQEVAALLDAIGGALPVTIEQVHRDGRVVINRTVQAEVQRRAQQGLLAIQIVGLRDGQLVLRAGPALLEMPASALISGVPSDVLPSLISHLTRGAMPQLWVRWQDGVLTPGLCEDGVSEISVVPLIVASGPDDGSCGCVTMSLRSGRLYWLGATHAAWTTLAEGDMRAAWSPGRDARPLSAMRLPNGGVSLIDTALARDEFRGAMVGSEQHVDILDTGDRETLLARSRSARILFRMQRPRGNLPDHSGWVVIRERSQRPQRLLAIAKGEVWPTLDLPETVVRRILGHPQQDAPEDAEILAVEPRQPVPELLRVARAWARDAATRSELPLIPALRAVLILLRHDPRLGVTLLRQLSRRAARSRHVEDLCAQWLDHAPGLVASPEWLRLANIARRLVLRDRQGGAAYGTPEVDLAGLVKSVAVRDLPRLAPVVAALEAARGQASYLDASSGSPGAVLSRLRQLARRIPRRAKHLGDGTLDDLQSLLEELERHGTNLALLDDVRLIEEAP